MSNATSAPLWTGPTPPAVNPNNSTVSALRPRLHVDPADPNHCGAPTPIPVGPRFTSACQRGEKSALSTPTAAPSVRPAESPADPVGTVTPGTTATATARDRSVRHLSAKPRSPTPVPSGVRPYPVPETPSCHPGARPTFRFRSQLVASSKERTPRIATPCSSSANPGATA